MGLNAEPTLGLILVIEFLEDDPSSCDFDEEMDRSILGLNILSRELQW